MGQQRCRTEEGKADSTLALHCTSLQSLQGTFGAVAAVALVVFGEGKRCRRKEQAQKRQGERGPQAKHHYPCKGLEIKVSMSDDALVSESLRCFKAS